MKSSHLLSAVIVGLMVTGVQAADPEYKNECTMGLATKKHIPTDCSVTWKSENGKTYEPLAKFSITTGLIGGVAVVQRYGGHRSIGDEAFKSW